MLEQILKAERKRDCRHDTDRYATPAKRKRIRGDDDDDDADEATVKRKKKRDDDDDRDEAPAKRKRGDDDDDDEAPAKRKRKRDDDDDDDDDRDDAASSSTTMLVQLLQQLTGNAFPKSAGVSTGTEPPAPADPRAAERARIAADKEAKKAEKKEAAAVAKAADLVKRKATQDVGLAAKAQVLLSPVADALKAIEIKDDLEAVVKEPLQQAKDNIAKYMKEAAAMQAAAKKKGFYTSGHQLDWTQKDIGAALTSAKEAMKKYEQFVRMFRT